MASLAPSEPGSGSTPTPTYHLSEGGIRVNDGRFERASFHRQALQLRYVGTSDDAEHPHALARVLFLLRMRLAELRSLPPRLFTTDPRAPALLGRRGGDGVPPLRKQIWVLERAIERVQGAPGVRDHFSWEAIGSVIDFPGSEASDQQWEEARRQTSSGADAEQAAIAAALPRSFLLPAVAEAAADDGEGEGEGEEDTDPYRYFAEQSEDDGDEDPRNSADTLAAINIIRTAQGLPPV